MINLESIGINVTTTNDGGISIVNNHRESLDAANNNEELISINAYNNALNGIDALIMTLHSSGYDINEVRFVDAVESALEQIGNNI